MIVHYARCFNRTKQKQKKQKKTKTIFINNVRKVTNTSIYFI